MNGEFCVGVCHWFGDNMLDGGWFKVGLLVDGLPMAGWVGDCLFG